MRLINLIAAVAAIFIGLIAHSTTAQAGGFERWRAPAGWGHTQTVHRYVYRPRHRYVAPTHSHADRYRYRYEPRGYYPYYNSRYWKPRRHVYRPNYDFKNPRYHAGWGRPKHGYHHRSWHDRNHGRHRFWRW